MELSVGVVSGLIAIAIALMQLLVPNALALILVAALSDEHPAVTWSVVSRTLANSHWPVVLRSDTATSQGVPRRVSIITWIRPLALLVIAAAAIVTPMGLFEGLVLTRDTQPTAFGYVADTGTMGAGTPPRSDLGFSRVCWDILPAQCPGTTVVIDRSIGPDSANATIEDDAYDRRVPEVLAKLYQSGLSQQARSVSSFFDIQARQYQFQNQYNINNDSYAVDSYKTMGTLIMDESITLVEGLIVDMRQGGVGFRRHTVPAGLRYGAEWDEDILFLQPETSCVNVNITMETRIPPRDNVYNSSTPAAWLVDQGGFVNINKTSPYLDPWFTDYQDELMEKGDPNLQARAYRAGWWMNVLNMYYFNVTKPDTNRTAYLTSELGQRFPVNNSYGYTYKDQLAFGDFSNLMTGIPLAFEAYNGSLILSNSSSLNPPYYANPFNMTTLNWTDVGPLCTAALSGDLANMTNLAVRCGLLLGPSKRRDGSTSSIVEPGSWWTRPIYSCASTTKAVIKTARFNYNATNTAGGLNSLRVVRLEDKVYGNRSEMPLWGVEAANMTLRGVSPLWGIIDPKLKDSVNLTTIRAEKLYIPASRPTVWLTELPDSITGDAFTPAIDGPSMIWNRVWTSYRPTSDYDYSASSNLALLQKWQNLTGNATGSAHIANLIWTDYASNYFLGTRSWQTPPDFLPPNLMPQGSSSPSPRARQRRQASDSTGGDDGATDEAPNGLVPIREYQRRVRYHLVYFIPAGIALVLVGVVVCAALVAAVAGRGTPARLRHYIWTLSAGRMLGAFLFPDGGDEQLHADTAVWVGRVGARNVRLGPEADREDKGGSGGVYGMLKVMGGKGATAPAGAGTYEPVTQKEPPVSVDSASTAAFESGNGVPDGEGRYR